MREKMYTPSGWMAILCDNGFEYEIVGPSHIDEDDCQYVAICCDGARDSDTEANAHLIAAAPELLEALEEVVRIADRKTDEFDRAKAAISKAYGESEEL